MKGCSGCLTTSKKASPCKVTSRKGPEKDGTYIILEPALSQTVEPSGRIVLVLLPFCATISLDGFRLFSNNSIDSQTPADTAAAKADHLKIFLIEPGLLK